MAVVAPHLPPSLGVSDLDDNQGIIRDMIREEWGQESPRDFQVDGIEHQAMFDPDVLSRPSLCLVRKTGDGKSLVCYGTVTLLRGVTVLMSSLV